MRKKLIKKLIKKLRKEIIDIWLMIGVSFFSTAVQASSTAMLQLKHYENYPYKTQQLIEQALHLSNQNLTYLYGSADPKKGGMDCSGTIYHLLKNSHIKDVPRQANDIYRWVWQKGHFVAVNSDQFSSFEFSKLKPGYLLFWSGTYNTTHTPPISHVMLYLGHDYHNHPIMFGSSYGRSYLGKPISGVGLYDFKLPSRNSKARFLGYGCIPSFSCEKEKNTT